MKKALIVLVLGYLAFLAVDKVTLFATFVAGCAVGATAVYWLK